MAPPLIAVRLGRVEYGQVLRLQRRLAVARRSDAVPDLLLVVEHPPVLTFGQGGGADTLRVPATTLTEQGVGVYQVERGGQGTFHGPGQVVLYPILKWPAAALHELVTAMEEGVIQTLACFGIAAGRDPENPGVWCGREKIAAIGLAHQEGVIFHGVALNVSTQLEYFSLFTPCGLADRGVVSMARLLNTQPKPERVAAVLVAQTARALGRSVTCGFTEAPWLKVTLPPPQAMEPVRRALSDEGLNTVCESADCPNQGECFAAGTATFLLLGPRCTRKCAYCSVPKGKPTPPDPQEPQRLARAAAQLGLTHVVITSVCRDDLPDGGASQFAAAITAVRRRRPESLVEVLVPDFLGSPGAVEKVIAARPDVFNHNVETVPRLYGSLRPVANYRRSLAVLQWAAAAGITTKSGLMLGLGETRGEVLEVLADLRRVGCQVVTLGQYLAPGERSAPVVEYVHPEEFSWYKEEGRRLGFKTVLAGPLVRSSYHAAATLSLIAAVP